MGKQKIVIRVSMEDTKKRSKALKTAVGLPGVVSAALEGDRIVVVGDGIDAISLTLKLRKQMGFADLVSVAPAGEKKEVDEKGGEKSANPDYWPYQGSMVQPYLYEIREPSYEPPPPCCSVM